MEGTPEEATMKNVLKLQKLALKTSSLSDAVAISCSSCDSNSCNKQAE